MATVVGTDGKNLFYLDEGKSTIESAPIAANYSGGDTNPSILYASPSGNDSNDGLSWQTAKLTIKGGLVALPGGDGNITIGNGVVYYMDGTAAHPTASVGIWIMGTNDPNYASPPAGWLKLNALDHTGYISIIGVPTANAGPNPHLGRANLASLSGASHGIWLSAITGPMYFENIAIGYPTKGYVIGVDSNGNITTSASGCTGLTFKNCTGATAGSYPTWIIGGESYWIQFVDCGGTGNIGQNGLIWSDDNAQAFLIDGRNSSGGQIITFKGTTNLSQGGIKIYGGTDPGNFDIEDVTEEGSFSASVVAPVVWYAGGSGLSFGRASQLLIADGGSTTIPAFRNDTGACWVVGGAWGVNINTQGQCIVLSDYSNNYQNETVSPAQNRQAGFFGSSGAGTTFPRVFGQNDDARRLGLGQTRFANYAYTNPSSWTATDGNVTFTTGIADPFGGTNAGRISSTDTFESGVNLLRAGQPSFTVGDWLIIGSWVRSNSNNGTIQFPLSLAINGTGYTPSQFYAGYFIQGDGEWEYVIGISQVTVVGTGAVPEFQALVDNTHIMDIFNPIYLHIPNGTISANEAFSLAMSLASARNDAPLNSVSLPPTMKFMVDSIIEPLTTPPSSSSTGTTGQILWDANYVYICTATNTWKRVALSTF